MWVGVYLRSSSCVGFCHCFVPYRVPVVGPGRGMGVCSSEGRGLGGGGHERSGWQFDSWAGGPSSGTRSRCWAVVELPPNPPE